jgi:adenylate kinase
MQDCIIIVGPPCSGKSTIGRQLAGKLGYKYISSGDIARAMAEEDGTMENLDAGKMAPEDRMRDKMHEILSKSVNVVIDGFPRFYDQYEWLIENHTIALPIAVVVVDVSINELFNRVVNRGRSDDVAIRERMNYYMENTVPMISAIRKNIKTIDVNNNGRDVNSTVNKLAEYLWCRIW